MESKAVHWAIADRFDILNPATDIEPSLYNLDAVPYGSIMLGFFQIHYGPSNEVGEANGIPKITELNFAYSRDGFHGARPDKNCTIRCGDETSWDRGYVQSLGNICTVDDDRINFYYIGFQGEENGGRKHAIYHRGSTGMAFLRRDGFASMDASEDGGEILTGKIQFTGSELFVNVDSSKGSFLAEFLDENENVIPELSRDDCEMLQVDSTKVQIKWKSGSSPASLAGKKSICVSSCGMQNCMLSG